MNNESQINSEEITVKTEITTEDATTIVNDRGPDPVDNKQQYHQQADTRKEQKNLKANNYEKLAPTMPFKYVMANNKKGIVAEICAVSPVHACNLLGWRTRCCKVLEIKKNIVEKSETTQTQETVELVEKV